MSGDGVTDCTQESEMANLEIKDSEGSVGPDNGEYVLSLDTLPKELLLHVCSFLDAKFVIKTLANVCQYFHGVISDSFFWKARIGKRLKKKYPAIPVVESEYNWQEACIAIEEQHRLWSNNAAQMDYFKFSEGVFAAVDSVHLMQNGSILAAGSRDRYLNLLNVDKLDPEQPKSFKEAKILTQMNAHKGWIWSLSSLGSVLATGSWDTYIKFWDVAVGGQQFQTLKAKSAVLCTHYEPNCFLAGGYDKKVYHFDPRTCVETSVKRYHSRSVLSLVANDRYIVTGSEDKTIVAYDRRADKVLKTLTLADFPMSMWYEQDQLWVGDKLGLVHLIDATDGDFNVVETYDVGHQGKVTGIIQTGGSLITCSMDKTIKVMEPCLSVSNPTCITTLRQHTADMAAISFQNNILAGASSDCSVGIWKPKNHQDKDSLEVGREEEEGRAGARREQEERIEEAVREEGRLGEAAGGSQE